MPLELQIIEQPWMQTIVGLSGLVGLAVLANWIGKRIALDLFRRALARSAFVGEQQQLGAIARRLSNLAPALVVQVGVSAVPHMPATAVNLTRNVAAAAMILTVALAISAALGLVNDVYQRGPNAAHRPIKGYLQVGKIVVYAAMTILIIATLADRSPLLLLSGLGALAAVLMLVFKDTILSLVASIQIGSNDMVRVGDWLEMPQLNADGDVIDIALHTVKVQNWDKTITTIPTYRLITESFKNWRGMSEAGGRRIKRALMIDQTSVGFLSPQQTDELGRFALLAPYLSRKKAEITKWNAARPERRRNAVNARRLTNIGTFRAYVNAYLEDRADISKEMTLIVRQLDPSPSGLPIEVYGFTTTTAWNEYEAIQSDIFDHLIAILPEFGLRLFQQPTGRDLRALGDLASAA